jgi:hypothetical protein
MDADYAVTLKILDVSTGQFSHSADEFMGGTSRELYNGIKTLVANFVKGMSAAEGGQVVQVAQAGKAGGSGKEYKIGDFGPAGGHVFYDKGVFSNGWRYLEAAPVETEFTAPWGASGRDVAGTGPAVAKGKGNTQLIVEYLGQLGERGRAAQLCESLDFDGYKDWFLPSKDELNLMYQNLKRKGLGDFSDAWYLSSSQINTGKAWVQRFSEGIWDGSNENKNYSGSVRAVRSF